MAVASVISAAIGAGPMSRTAPRSHHRSLRAVRCQATDRPAGDGNDRRALLLSAAGLLVSLPTAPAALAVDFKEAQAEREARKQALLEAARAKATGEPVPEVEPLGSYEGPSATDLDISKLSYPADAPKEEKGKKEKKKDKEAKKTTKAAGATGGSSSRKASGEKKKKSASKGSQPLEVMDKRSLAKEREARKEELLRKAREKALAESSDVAPAAGAATPAE